MGDKNSAGWAIDCAHAADLTVLRVGYYRFLGLFIQSKNITWAGKHTTTTTDTIFNLLEFYCHLSIPCLRSQKFQFTREPSLVAAFIGLSQIAFPLGRYGLFVQLHFAITVAVY